MNQLPVQMRQRFIPNPQLCKCANNATVSSKGSISLPVLIHKSCKSIQVKFTVLSESSSDVYLGIPFFEETKAKIDFASKRITISLSPLTMHELSSIALYPQNQTTCKEKVHSPVQVNAASSFPPSFDAKPGRKHTTANRSVIPERPHEGEAVIKPVQTRRRRKQRTPKLEPNRPDEKALDPKSHPPDGGDDMDEDPLSADDLPPTSFDDDDENDDDEDDNSHDGDIDDADVDETEPDSPIVTSPLQTPLALDDEGKWTPVTKVLQCRPWRQDSYSGNRYRLELADGRIIFATEGRVNDATRALAAAK